MSQDAINDLIKRAVENAAAGPVHFRWEEQITEAFDAQNKWEGNVRTYMVTQSVKPLHAYGWHVRPSHPEHPEHPEPRFIARVGNPPVNSAASAVREWLASEATKPRTVPERHHRGRKP